MYNLHTSLQPCHEVEPRLSAERQRGQAPDLVQRDAPLHGGVAVHGVAVQELVHAPVHARAHQVEGEGLSSKGGRVVGRT